MKAFMEWCLKVKTIAVEIVGLLLFLRVLALLVQSEWMHLLHKLCR
jgi:hypothetical protein